MMALPEVLMDILNDLLDEDFEKFKWYLNINFPLIKKSQLKADRCQTVSLIVQSYPKDAVDVTTTALEKINRNDLVEKLQKITSDLTETTKTVSETNREESANPHNKETPVALCQRKLKFKLQKKFHCVFEGIAAAGQRTSLNHIYTELYITEERSAEFNKEHEAIQIETASREHDRPETVITCNNIFKGSADSQEPIRGVLTKGVAGVGKTFLTQKFSLDWAEGNANQDIQFTFPFTFRELNVLRKKEKKFSLVQLVHCFFNETKKAGICSFEDFHVVFIFDGLDECRPPLDFYDTDILSDETEPTTVDVLLINLIKGNLLPSAHLWITTRPAAAEQIPTEYVDLVTEIRGFNDKQKKEYFKKKFTDKYEAKTVISHIRTSRSLHIMCHIPVFCWITAGVLKKLLENPNRGALPKTLTEMYIRFLLVQAKWKDVKYDGRSEAESRWNKETVTMMESLGKLAFEQLQNGNLMFNETDLMESGIDLRAASVYSGVFTEIFKEESCTYEDKVFCFIHLSVQEFLAALHARLIFINTGVNVLSEEQNASQSYESAETQFYQTAVDTALQSPNGHLDLFLRFLLGLSLPTNQRLLHGLMKQTESSSETSEKTAKYIQKKLDGDLSVEKSFNLFHCLNELNDRSLMEEIQQWMGMGVANRNLSPAQWSALVFILLSSDRDLDVFDIQQYCSTEEALLNLLPVIKASNTAILTVYDLSDRSCEALFSVLNSPSSSLRNLHLSNINLKDSEVKILSCGLKHPDCKVESLRLSDCNLSERSCEALSSVLSSCSSLRFLDVGNNDLKDAGVKILSDGLRSPHCTLETLRLPGCLITDEGCSSLLSALTSNPSHLRRLDVRYNHPGDSGQKLFAALEDPHWALKYLRLEPSGVQWLKPGLRKYFCELTLDPNTANRSLKLSENNKKVTYVDDYRPSPGEHGRLVRICEQVMCSTPLTGRCYWEVECDGGQVAVAYKDPEFDWNNHHWSLECRKGHYTVYHINKPTVLDYSSSCFSGRVATYVDVPGGSVSFYEVSSDQLTHLYTFYTTFTKPLYAGLWPSLNSSLSLCDV